MQGIRRHSYYHKSLKKSFKLLLTVSFDTFKYLPVGGTYFYCDHLLHSSPFPGNSLDSALTFFVFFRNRMKDFIRHVRYIREILYFHSRSIK